ncbi:MAG: TIR domain-containing protein [Clostridia bacterium]|nr:TIR domain-containing protein [Clostridia bacterium]
MKTPYVFISYSTKDQEHADKVYETLTQQGINCWIATHDIHGGESFAEEITSAVNGCKAFVFIVSQNSDNSPHVGNELSLAFSARKKIIPFRLHEFELSKSNTYFLQQAQWIDLFEDEDLAYSELIKAVNQALESKDADFSTVKIKTGGNKKIENQIKRAYLSLEDGDFLEAKKHANEALDVSAECAEAYLIYTLSDFKVTNKQSLIKHKNDLLSDKNFAKAIRFAQGELKTQLEEIKRTWAYNTALPLLKDLTDESNYKKAKSLLEIAGEYNGAEKAVDSLDNERELQLKEYNYNAAIKLLDKLTDERNYSLAKDLLTRASNYKDANYLLKKIESDRKIQIKEFYYNEAKKFLENGAYSAAKSSFTWASGYKDADEILSNFDKIQKEKETKNDLQNLIKQVDFLKSEILLWTIVSSVFIFIGLILSIIFLTTSGAGVIPFGGIYLFVSLIYFLFFVIKLLLIPTIEATKKSVKIKKITKKTYKKFNCRILLGWVVLILLVAIIVAVAILFAVRLSFLMKH